MAGPNEPYTPIDEDGGGAPPPDTNPSPSDGSIEPGGSDGGPPPAELDPGIVDETQPFIPNDPAGNQEPIPDYQPRQYGFGAPGGGINISRPDMEDMYQPGDVGVPETGRSQEFVPWEVTREQTVAGQLTDLYDRDSPFFEVARERGVRRHLAGGGQNSAMAAQAGEIAAMDKAFDVARQDAATYARSGEFNAAMQNQFSLAEQRFVHNALLSDQNYNQAVEMEKMRIDAQFESIIMDYQGRGQLLDKEIGGRLKMAAQQHEYAMDMLWEQEQAFEGREQRGFGRTMTLNGMIQMTNFWSNYVNSTMQYASNPNWTPQQAQAALNEGLQSGNQLFDYLQSFWGGWAAGGPPNTVGPPGFSNWWDFSNAPGQQPTVPLPGTGG